MLQGFPLLHQVIDDNIVGILRDGIGCFVLIHPGRKPKVILFSFFCSLGLLG